VSIADEITVSAPFLRSSVALSASKSTRPKGADTVITSGWSFPDSEDTPAAERPRSSGAWTGHPRDAV